MQPNRRRLLRLAIIVIILIIVGMIAYGFYANRPRSVNIIFAKRAPVRVEVYKAALQQSGDQTPSGRPLVTVDGDQVVKLRPGFYVAKTTGSADYAEVFNGFRVEDKGGTVTIDPTLTQTALARMVDSEKASINAALAARFTKQDQYKITNYTLYKRGEWAGVVLKVNKFNDFFHVVLKKEGTNWEVLTEPAIILSTPVYPDIPRDVLIEVNKKQFNAIRER